MPYGIALVQADPVSDAAAGNRTLCIIDSGIDGTHPDLQGLPIAGENLTTSGPWDTDESSHGTQVAGTMSAVGGKRVGVVGVVPGKTLKLYIAKVFDATGSTSSSTVAKAMLARRKNGGARVITTTPTSRLRRRVWACCPPCPWAPARSWRPPSVPRPTRYCRWPARRP